MSEREAVDLTQTQRAVLTKRYQEFQEAEQAKVEAEELVNEALLLVAGEGAQLALKNGQVVVYPPEAEG